MKVMVDVDNTLCEFAEVLNEELLKINDKIPNHLNWNHWNFYRDYGISDKDFYDAAHRAQDRILECREIPGAGQMMCTLKRCGHHIVIASHRKKENIPILEEWLERKDMEYDEIHASNDKTVLFEDECVKLVIDDSPVILNKACEKGLLTIGIRKPWNKDVRGEKVFMIDNYFTIDPSIREILAMAEV